MISRQITRAAIQWATRGLILKASLIAGVVAVIILLVVTAVGSITAASSAGASEVCGTAAGLPEMPEEGAGSVLALDQSTRAHQVQNAQIIDQVAIARGLSGRATEIALMTAWLESTMTNLPYGTLDSVGLFQQRPSMGWGSKEQLLDRAYAASAFFGGPEPPRNPGLVEVRGWESMPMDVAAQKVQRSDHPELYAGYQRAAEQIAAEAGIDLARPGSAPAETAPEPDVAETQQIDAPGADMDQCPDAASDGPPSAAFHDGAAEWPDAVRNPRSTADAIAWAQSQSGGGPDWFRRCLAFVASAYGWHFSGTEYAIDHYQVTMPAAMRHDGDRNPPPGALLFWSTNSRAGHVAIYIGNGMAASNDIHRPGHIDVVPVGDFETKWRAHYLG